MRAKKGRRRSQERKKRIKKRKEERNESKSEPTRLRGSPPYLFSQNVLSN